MQVLLITIILAGIATMILRATLSRTTSARRTRRIVSSQVLIQACMAEVNMLWSKKTPEAFRRDLVGDTNGPYMYCKGTNTNSDVCPSGDIVREYTCQFTADYPYVVRARFVPTNKGNRVHNSYGGTMWQLEYEVVSGSNAL